jgi:hypothetical protein
MNTVNLQRIKEYWNIQYSYISLELSDKEILNFMEQSYVQNKSFEMQMDMLQDYIVSQGLGEVME